MMGYLFNGMGWWMVFGILFWGGIIWLIVWAVKRTTEHRGSHHWAKRTGYSKDTLRQK